MIPIEGIDKIKVLLNPALINPGCKTKHIHPYNWLTLHDAGFYKSFSIHQEWFNPYADYQLQIANAIYFLIKKEVLGFPDRPDTLNFIYRNPYYFFSAIIEAEFYSDFNPKRVEVSDEAFKNGKLIRYFDRETGNATNTFYSPDYDAEMNRHSTVIHYDKDEKNKHDNHIKYKKLAENKNTIRLEYRLYKNNMCQYLHWDNFRGNYWDIFNRYKGLLAVHYNNYIAGNIITHGKENTNWNKVKRIADRNRNQDMNIQQRYRGKKLTKTDTKMEQNIELNQIAESALGPITNTI